MKKGEPEEAEKFYRFTVKEECQEVLFEECMCELLSYLESDYFENERDMRSFTTRLIRVFNINIKMD